MSFATSYELLNSALNEEAKVKEAVLGDIFLPNPDMPDLGLPIGYKIEKNETFAVARSSGILAVTHTCKVISLDHEQLSQTIDPSELITWIGQPTPDLYLWQGVGWNEANEKAAPHHSRLFRGFTQEEMLYGDKLWEDYNSEYKEWLRQNGFPDDTPEPDIIPDEPNYPFEPDFFQAHIRTPAIDNDEMYPIDDHAAVLAQVGSEHAELEVLTVFNQSWGHNLYGKYTPAQFLAMTNWLLELTEK